jgi:hypothetical protein
VEQSDGTTVTRYEYSPEATSPGQSLLIASTYYSSANFEVFDSNGELIFRNSTNEMLLWSNTSYLYDPSGRLVEIRHSRPT